MTMRPEIPRTRQGGRVLLMRLAGVVACVLMTGCATLDCAGSKVWDEINKRRRAGPQLVDPPQKVSVEFDCPNRPQPWVLLETQELQPGRVAVNHELNERFVYMLCPAPGQGEVRGTLTRRVLMGKTEIWVDTVRDYDLKPGRWSVDVLLPIPEQTAPGLYEFEVRFETKKLIFRDTRSFTVVRCDRL